MPMDASHGAPTTLAHGPCSFNQMSQLILAKESGVLLLTDSKSYEYTSSLEIFEDGFKLMSLRSFNFDLELTKTPVTF